MNAVTQSTITIASADRRTSARVVPARGAILTSLQVDHREVLYLDESTLLDPTKNVRGGVPVLFPSPGKLVNDEWRQSGKKGALKQHGLARTEAWSVVNQERDRLLLRLGFNEKTMQAYPWKFVAELAFTAKSRSVRIATTVRNEDDTPMPYALGFHPYLNVTNKASVSIKTDATRVFNNVSKNVEAFRGFDFSTREVDLHLLDHNDASCILRSDDGEVVVSASEDFGIWVIWSLADKPFVCVEPWTALGNALNTGERLAVLKPGEVRTSWIEIEYRDR